MKTNQRGKTCSFPVLFLSFIALLLALSGPLQAQAEPGTDAAEMAETTEPAEELPQSQAEVVKKELERSARGLGDWIDHLGRESGGGWLEEVVLGISRARVVASLALLLLVAAFTALMLYLIRSRAGRIHGDKDLRWTAMILTAVRKPLALVFSIYGVYFAFVLLIDGMPGGDFQRAALKVATTSTYFGLAIAAFWLVFRLIRGLQTRMQIWARRTGGVLENVMVPLIGQALRMLVPLVALFLLIPSLNLPSEYEWITSKLMGMLLIGSVAYILIKAVRVTEKTLLEKHRLDVEDNLEARKIYTQVSVIRKIVVVTVSVLAAACVLMLFDPVRQLGASILASAGIAGIVLGFAAQKTLGNLLAGIQIALTQPIRIDDVVIVEGEWGRIEEITLSYVVVRIWDMRRLVVPINYFIDNAFQNWTRTSADILGTVFLYVDYSVPVDEIRRELRRLVEDNPLWDGKVCGLQVTNATENAVELRCLASSADASKNWDLRCQLRERLIAFIKEKYPTALPRLRAEFRALGEEDVEAPHPPASSPRQPEQEGSSQPGIEAKTEPKTD